VQRAGAGGGMCVGGVLATGWAMVTGTAVSAAMGRGVAMGTRMWVHAEAGRGRPLLLGSEWRWHPLLAVAGGC